jgi:hypothetical protein
MNTETITLTPAGPVAPRAASATIPRQRFATQFRLELRKLVDTRSGQVLLGLILATSACIIVYLLVQPKYEVTFHRYSMGAANTVAFLAPIIGLMAMTSEWTQRTALTTFVQSPRRGRVIAAKFAASITLSTVMLGLVLLLAAAGTGLGGAIRGDVSWAGLTDDIRTYLIVMLLQVIMACAFGALAGQTALAIGAYLAAPVVWAELSRNVLGDTAPWFDIFEAYNRLSSNQPWDDLGQTLTSVAVWVALPAVLGVRRSLRREIK